MTDKNKSPDEGPRFEETFDFDVPPAPDVNAFARHAGEIIASATAAKQSKYRCRPRGPELMSMMRGGFLCRRYRMPRAATGRSVQF
jgi:hypothetical protein